MGQPRMRLPRLLAVALLLAVAALAVPAGMVEGKAPGKGGKQRKLERSNAKRWDRVTEIVRSEIRSATSKFLVDRGQVRPWRRRSARGLP